MSVGFVAVSVWFLLSIVLFLLAYFGDWGQNP
jgi:hypothetical protein